jgi:hypothetical protein
MSIRLAACGIDISEILAMFGSGKRELVERHKSELSEEQLRIFERAVMQGVPFPELDAEGWDHILLMKRLFRDAPDQTTGDVEMFGYVWLMDVMDELLEKLPAEARPLMRRFIDGRPIFGKRFDDTEALYGFLTASEVVTLNSAMAPFKLPEPDSPEWDDLPMGELEASYSEFAQAVAELLPRVVAKRQGLVIDIG